MSQQKAQKFDSLIDDILKKVPGVIGMLLINLDGEILYANGRFDILPIKLSMISAVCQGCLFEIGHGFNQLMSTIMVEFENLKIYHLNIADSGALIILTKTKDAQIGLLRMEAGKVIHAISKGIEGQ